MMPYPYIMRLKEQNEGRHSNWNQDNTRTDGIHNANPSDLLPIAGQLHDTSKPMKTEQDQMEEENEILRDQLRLSQKKITEYQELLLESHQLLKVVLTNHPSVQDAIENFEKLKEENERLHYALKYIAERLRVNMEGLQPYGGFHTVPEEFASILSDVEKALERKP